MTETDELLNPLEPWEQKKKSSRFKNLNLTKLTIRALLILFITGITFACSYWRDEGTLGTNAIKNFFADSFIIFQYPAVNLFYHIGSYNWTTYIFGLIIDAYIYAIVLGLIWKLISRFKKPKEEKEISMH